MTKTTETEEGSPSGPDIVYVTESGCIFEGGSVEKVFKTLEAAIASKPTKFSEYFEPQKGNDGNVYHKWHDTKEIDYFKIIEMKVDDSIPEPLKLLTCSHKGCKFRQYDYYYSDELDRDYKDICYECGDEALEKEIKMHKALK